MPTALTSATTSAITGHGETLKLILVFALISLLIAREAISGSPGTEASRRASILDTAIAPLTVVFALIVAARVRTLL